MNDPLRPQTVWRAVIVGLIVALACLLAFGILVTVAHL
jgi:uncharacterized membrane protein